MGVNGGWSSPYVPYLLSKVSPITVTPNEVSWCAISPLGGCLTGAFVGATLVDRLGRKMSLLLLAPVTFICFLGMAFTTHLWHLTVLRFIIGITDGAIYTVLPMYVGEIVEPEMRVFLSSSICYIYILGTLLINIIGPFLDIFTSSLIVSLFPAFHFLTFLYMPESPYYYVKNEKYNEAKKSLMILKGISDVDEELRGLKEVIEMENKMSNKPKLSDLYKIPSNRKACLIYLILIFINKASGKVPIMLHTTTIFQESGSTIDSTLSVIIYNSVELLIVIFVTLFVTKKFGKRLLMIISALGCSLSLFALASYFLIKYFNLHLLKHLNWLPITSLVSYNILFSFGLGFGPMSYLSELFPMNVKANASSVAQIISIAFGSFFAEVFQISHRVFGIHIPFFLFAFISAVGAIFICRIVPETRGKTLVEIQNILVQSSNVPQKEVVKGNPMEESYMTENYNLLKQNMN